MDYNVSSIIAVGYFYYSFYLWLYLTIKTESEPVLHVHLLRFIYVNTDDILSSMKLMFKELFNYDQMCIHVHTSQTHKCNNSFCQVLNKCFVLLNITAIFCWGKTEVMWPQLHVTVLYVIIWWRIVSLSAWLFLLPCSSKGSVLRGFTRWRGQLELTGQWVRLPGEDCIVPESCDYRVTQWQEKYLRVKTKL